VQTSFEVTTLSGVKLGPFSLSEIVDKLTKKELHENDQLFLDETKAWTPICEFGPIKKRLEIIAKMNHQAAPTPIFDGATDPSIAQKTEPVPLEETDPAFVPGVVPIIPEPVPLIRASAQHLAPPVRDAVVAASAPAPIVTAPSQFTAAPMRAAAPTLAAQLPNGVKLQIVNGKATIEIVHDIAEKISFKVSGNDALKLAPTPALQIQANQIASLVVWGSGDCIAGRDLIVHIEARDRFGNCVTHFNAPIDVEIFASQNMRSQVNIEQGRAEFRHKWTRAELVKLVFSYREQVMTAEHLCQIKPGEAKEVQMVMPPDAKAGQPVQVGFRAIDEFGNFVPDYKGSLDLSVEQDSKEVKPKIYIAS
jgi:hypothetical protein